MTIRNIVDLLSRCSLRVTKSFYWHNLCLIVKCFFYLPSLKIIDYFRSIIRCVLILCKCNYVCNRKILMKRKMCFYSLSRFCRLFFLAIEDRKVNSMVSAFYPTYFYYIIKSRWYHKYTYIPLFVCLYFLSVINIRLLKSPISK